MRALSTVKYPRANLLPEGEGIPLLFLAIFFIFFAAALVLVNFVLQFIEFCAVGLAAGHADHLHLFESAGHIPALQVAVGKVFVGAEVRRVDREGPLEIPDGIGGLAEAGVGVAAVHISVGIGGVARQHFIGRINGRGIFANGQQVLRFCQAGIFAIDNFVACGKTSRS